MDEKPNKGVFIPVRCLCGKRLGDIFGFFRLKCRQKHRHNGKCVIVEGYTHNNAVVIEGITPDF